MKRFSLLMFVVFLLLMIGVQSVTAQDATVTPAPDAPVVTVESGSAAINLITLIAGIGVGLIAGGGSVLFVVDRLRKDPATITAVEALAKSFPPETRELLNHLAGFLYEVTDDKAYVDKSPGNPANLN